MKKYSDKEIADLVWAFKHMGLNWTLCSELLSKRDIIISPFQLEKGFKDYFVNLTGIAPYADCPKCGSELLPKEGKFGRFVGCSAYPDCKYAAGPTYTGKLGMSEEEAENELKRILSELGRDSLTKCPKCERKLVIREGKKGIFIACSVYPCCKYIVRRKAKRRTKEEIQKDNEKLSNKLLAETGYAINDPCPVCEKKLVARKGRFGSYLVCSGSPPCKFVVTTLKESEKQRGVIQSILENLGYGPITDCPICGNRLRYGGDGFKFYVICSIFPKCKFKVYAGNRKINMVTRRRIDSRNEPYDILDEDGNVVMTINAKLDKRQRTNENT